MTKPRVVRWKETRGKNELRYIVYRSRESLNHKKMNREEKMAI